MSSQPIWPAWREFPPLLADKEKQKDEPMKQEMKSLIWRFIPVGLFALGIVFIIISKSSNISIWHYLFLELGIALIIASVLTFTVDKILKERLVSELKKDVFKATMGYLFPEEIRDEVKWFYNFPLLATRRNYYITITKLNEQYAEIITSDNATIKNISNESADIYAELYADEWGVNGYPTELLQLGYKHKGNRITASDNKDKLTTNIKLRTIQWTFGKIELAPKHNDGDEIEIWRTVKETKGHNYNIWWVSIWPTVSPEIRVSAHDFEVKVGYMGRTGSPQIQEYEKNAFRLPGTILPSQVLVVRWWPKGKD